MGRRSLMALVAVPAAALAGCGGSTAATVTRTVTTTAPAPSTAAQAGSTASAAARCRVGQLAVHQTEQQGAAGSIHLDYAFTNTSSKACTLDGYPGLGLLDAHGRPLPTHVLRQPSVVVPAVAERRVTLAPGRRAWFYAGYSDVSPTACIVASRLEVTPPDAYGHLTIPTRMAPCGGGRINVSPVFAHAPRI
jgi:hypothetical protein